MWPEWWEWEVVFTGHAELRMEQRGVNEVELRAMLQHASGYSPSAAAGRFMIQTQHGGQRWVVIVEPDAGERRLVVVTVYRGEQ